MTLVPGSSAVEPQANEATAAGSVGPSFVPRAIKRRPAAPPRPSSSQALVAKGSNSPRTPTAPASGPRAAADPIAKDGTRRGLAPHSSSSGPHNTPRPADVQRLESILATIESSFSDHGLSLYRSSGLLDRFKAGTEWIHVSQLLQLPPVRALTGTLADLTNAARLRESRIIKVDETGYQVGRRTQADVERLEQLDPAEWDDLSIYLENVPFNTSARAISPANPCSYSLTTFLSDALDTPIQRLVLPPLYDTSNPPDLAAEEDELDDAANDATGHASQAEAFKASLTLQAGASGPGGQGRDAVGKRTARGLPKGGGPFKGFAFVVVESKDDLERILREWRGRTREERAVARTRQDKDRDVEMEDGRQEEAEEGVKDKGKKKRKEMSAEEKARTAGMSAMRYSRWLELKKEYLAYRRTLENLLEAQATGELDRLRHPQQAKDEPPHLRARNEGGAATAAGGDSARKRHAKRASSPSHDGAASAPKRSKRASSPSTLGTPLTRHTRKLRTPSPSQSGLDLASDAALAIQGAYPEGCVLWVRNVHEKSSKTSLKALFGRLLDDLQEGSGKGVEFVDYEKGLETCYIRFSSSSLASLTRSHLADSQTYHLSPPELSPADSLSPQEVAAAEGELRRPIAVELLSGERERNYWASLPETTRRAARMGAGGKVALVKEPKRAHSEVQQGSGADRGEGSRGLEATAQTEGSRKRKKPSRM
ncbi:hypothetical protein JCM10212_003875 [Sporobolomyces blumeae]